jgi:hypothetical protein
VRRVDGVDPDEILFLVGDVDAAVRLGDAAMIMCGFSNTNTPRKISTTVGEAIWLRRFAPTSTPATIEKESAL